VLVTHDSELAARCERVLRMHSGRIEESRMPVMSATRTS